MRVAYRTIFDLHGDTTIRRVKEQPLPGHLIPQDAAVLQANVVVQARKARQISERQEWPRKCEGAGAGAVRL